MVSTRMLGEDPPQIGPGTYLMSEAIRGHQRPSEAIRGHQRPSEAIRGHQRPSEAIREAIRSHQGARTSGAP